MHMDASAARRTQAGSPVVHGMHAVLWALDELLAGQGGEPAVVALKVVFQKFQYVGSGLELFVTKRSEFGTRMELVSQGLKTSTIDVAFGREKGPAAQAGRRHEPGGVPSEPAALDFEHIEGLEGELRLTTVAETQAMFPRAARHLGAIPVNALARLSALVGMMCPGLHSIFSGFNVRFDATLGRDATSMRYGVSSVDDRFRMVELGVSGAGFDGVVTAFVRQPPVSQPTMADVRRLVRADEFAGVNALVVGGSRGLGALTARIVAAGGGHVAVTYFVGNDEADALVAEIGAERARALRYDASLEARAQLPDVPFNQLYYFATPQIFRQTAAVFSAQRFEEFCRIYVDGFYACYEALRSSGKFAAFYPSSVALEDRPKEMTEYSMAKAAGEILCADINRFVKGARIVVKRLPRVLTDQTATLTTVESADPVEVMLPIVREMRTVGN